MRAYAASFDTETLQWNPRALHFEVEATSGLKRERNEEDAMVDGSGEDLDIKRIGTARQTSKARIA